MTMADQVSKNPLIKQAWLRVLLFGCCFILVTLAVAIPALQLIAGIKPADLAAHPLTTVAAFSPQYLWLFILIELVVSLISVGGFVLLVDRRPFVSLGWTWSNFQQEALTGLFFGPALLGLSAVIMLLSGHLEWTDITWDPSALFVSLGLMLMIAFSEEIVFRGYVLGSLLDTFPNKWIALIISSLLFAVFHISHPGMQTLAFINLFLAGLLLGVNYMYSRNLWFSVMLHFSWNFMQGPILGFRVSGFALPSVLVAEPKGDLFITGGDFGLEASIMNTALCFIAIFVLAWAFEKKYQGRPLPTLDNVDNASPVAA